MVFAIEGSRFGRIEPACNSVVRVVEPKADVKSVGRGQVDAWIKAKDLVDQDRMQGAENLTRGIRLKVCLIPGEPEIREIRIRITVGPQ